MADPLANLFVVQETGYGYKSRAVRTFRVLHGGMGYIYLRWHESGWWVQDIPNDAWERL